MTQPGEDLHELDLPRLATDDRDMEAPDADAYEQSVPADPAAQAPHERRLPLEANEADAVEQSQVVAGLDDEYR